MKNILEKEVLAVKLDEKEMKSINCQTAEIIDKLRKVIKKKKVKAEVFLGGSLAKGTLMRKKKHDIDIFVRFDKPDSDVLEKLLKLAGLKVERIHGSRDYFRTTGKIMFEIVPVLKIKKPEQAENVTDLSYFHVSYITRKIKKHKQLGDEIILAKHFCHVHDCYGAEGYVKGFSGYALELLVSYYGSFVKFLQAVVKSKSQIVLDPERHYKNKQDILNNMNESKLGPIVFVDPTFKQRNALAALSKDTFEKFKLIAQDFLKHPSPDFFRKKEINKKNFNLIIEVYTNRQAGDVAGSKLFKFFRFVEGKLSAVFDVKGKDFEYNDNHNAVCYFNIKSKERILHGPPIDKVENLLMFKQAHKHVFIKAGKAYAKEKAITSKEFLKNLKSDKALKEMNVKII